jgi:hypothetical protein
MSATLFIQKEDVASILNPTLMLSHLILDYFVIPTHTCAFPISRLRSFSQWMTQSHLPPLQFSQHQWHWVLK